MNEAVTGLELNCKEVIDFILAYLDGELPARERAIFDAHLPLCRDCQDYLDSYRATLAILKQSNRVPPCAADLPKVPEDLLKAILASRE